MHANIFFLVAPRLCYTIPPQKRPFMLPGSHSFEREKPQVAMSFTDMLNASDDFSISTPGSHYSRRFEPDSLDDALFSSAQISGSTPTTVSSVEDTRTNSPAYLRLARQFTSSQLELRVLKQEHHHLQYIFPTKTPPTILRLCDRLMHEDLVQAHKMLVAIHAETIEANKSKWLRREIAPSPALQTIPSRHAANDMEDNTDTIGMPSYYSNQN
jgi:hypothetical protein